MISPTAIIDKQVKYGKGCAFDDFVIVGKQTSSGAEPRGETVLGDDCKIRCHSVIYANNIIGDRFTTGHHAIMRDGNKIGDDVSLGSLSIIEYNVCVGDGVRIHSQAFVPEYCELASGAWIGPGVRLTNSKYPNSRHSKKYLTGVIVGKDAIIGANAVILPGVKIGERALIGAGAVVTRDVDANSVMAGNPAIVLGYTDEMITPGEPFEKPYG